MKMKLATAPLSKEEIQLRDAMVRKALAENLEVRQFTAQLMGNKMELERIEKRSQKHQADPLYIRQKEEIEICERNLEAFKEGLKEQIQEEFEFSVRARRGDGGIGIGPNSEATVLAKRREELARMRMLLRSYEIAEIDLRKACREQTEKFLKELEALSGENVNLTFKRDELAEKQAVLTRIQGAADCVADRAFGARAGDLARAGKGPRGPGRTVALPKHGAGGVVGLLLAVCVGGGLGRDGAANRRLGGPGTPTALVGAGGDFATADAEPSRLRTDGNADQRGPSRLPGERRQPADCADSRPTICTTCGSWRSPAR